MGVKRNLEEPEPEPTLASPPKPPSLRRHRKLRALAQSEEDEAGAGPDGGPEGGPGSGPEGGLTDADPAGGNGGGGDTQASSGAV